MAFRAKNHNLKTYGSTKSAKKPTPAEIADEQAQAEQQLADALVLHDQANRYINRIVTGVGIVIAFLLCLIVANYNWQSTLATFAIASVAFYAVGAKKQNILMWVAILSIYVMTDNYLSHGQQFNMNRFPLHLGSLLIFLAIIHVTRPFLEKWMINSLQKQKDKLAK